MTGKPKQPNLIIIGYPELAHLVAASIYTLACCDCGKKYRVAPSTAMTVSQLTKQQTPPIVCWDCYSKALIANPVLATVDWSVAGMDQARRAFGLDN